MAELNSGIILAGQTPDFMGGIYRANEQAALQGDRDRQNALARLYQEQGGAIAQGDAGALNALARFSPEAALGVQGARQDMKHADERIGMQREQLGMQRERLELAKQQAAQTAQLQAQKLSAAERQAELDRTNAAIEAASVAQTPEQWNSFIGQAGLDPAEFPFEQREFFLAKAIGVKDALSVLKGPEPADEYGRYRDEEIAAGREPLSRIDYAQAKKGREVIYGPDGQPILERGPGNSAPKLTVDAAKNTGFLIRTQEANETLNNLESQGTRFWQQAAESAPMGLGNYARDPEFQRFDQARRDFVNAILRRESGAVISEEEFDNANKQYFPVPGDGPEVIAQKRRNRETAIEGLRVGSGDGAAYVDAQRPPAGTQLGETGADLAVAPEGIDQADWDYLTEDEKKLWVVN